MKNKLLLVLQLFIIDNIYSNNIIFPLSDPIYVLVRQEFLRFHDLSIIKKHSSLTNQYLIEDNDNIVYYHSIDKHNVSLEYGLLHIGKIYQF